MRTLAVLFWATVLASMTGCATQSDANEMNRLASALTKLSAAVDAIVRYDDIPPDTNGSAILTKAKALDPELLLAFEGRTVRVVRQGENSLVLVCDLAAKKALLEDAGCTAKMDLHRWDSLTPSSCEATLDLPTVCSQH